MIILSIETSCDETAVSILDARGSVTNPKFKVLGNALYSQEKLHAPYGGVYPNLARREHQQNLVPLLVKALRDAKLFRKRTGISRKQENIHKVIKKVLKKESTLYEHFSSLLFNVEKPKIGAIAVTVGPGLEPALWVGVNFATAVAKLWGLPVIPVNHMEGHIMSVLLKTDTEKNKKDNIRINYPAISLLISGGHTELVYSKKPFAYKIIGKTRDDALGEAFDKVARMIGLPYPGGPGISRLAEIKRNKGYKKEKWSLPRPMIHSKDLDFSFSGLKTSILYKTKNKKLSTTSKEEISKEFEDAVTEVIISKTRKALDKFSPRSLVVGGGVINNTYIRAELGNLVNEYSGIKLFIPTRELSTDNSTMIGMAGFLQILNSPKILKKKRRLKAQGHLSFKS
jgi:N6-L-threonylcarbamoyladenine synthase